MNKDNSSASSVSDMSQSTKKSEFKRFQNLRLPTPPPDPTLSTQSSNTASSSTNVFEEAFHDTITKTDLIDKDIEFLDYLTSLSNAYQACSRIETGVTTKHPLLSRTNSVFTQAIGADDAFDHLDKLYKLMEQLLNLREQNSKLQQRVRALEHFKTLQEMHQQVENDFLGYERLLIQDLEADPAYADSLLNTMLAAGRNASSKRSSKYKAHSKFRQSILGKPRDRCSSIPLEELETIDDGNVMNSADFGGKFRRCSSSIQNSPGKPAKVSKWTKVKAAFKWEKASSTVGSGSPITSLPVAKSQDSGIGGMNSDSTCRYLRVPNIPSGGGVSPADSVLSGHSSQGLGTAGTHTPVTPSVDLSTPATPASLSAVSSVEDLHAEQCDGPNAGSKSEKSLEQRISAYSDDEENRREQRRSKSLDDTIADFSSQNLKDEESIYYTKNWQQKSHKTPWGKVKDIIQTRKDSLKKAKNRSSIKLDENPIQIGKQDNPPGLAHMRKKSDSATDFCSLSYEHDDVFEKLDVREKKQNPPSLILTIPSSEVKKDEESEKTSGEIKMIEAKIVKEESKKLEGSSRNSSFPDEDVQDDEKNTEIIKGDKTLVKRENRELSHSPQSRRNSKWMLVKKAFLNKQEENETSQNSKMICSPSIMSTSIPSSPLQDSSFFSDNDATFDAYSNEVTKCKHRNDGSCMRADRKLREEIQKNYEDLQNKLSLEFKEKLQEWERIKQNQSNMGTAASGTSPSSSIITEDHNIYHQAVYPDVEFQKKIDEWERMKQHQSFQGTKSFPLTPLSLTNEENLSADFKKKLQEWQRMKKLGTIAKEETSGSSSPIQHSSSKKKITDWQFFKHGVNVGASTSKSDNRQLGSMDTKQLSEDFLKKLEEWKKMKATNTVPSYTGDDEEQGSNHTSVKRKDFPGNWKSPRHSLKKSKTQDEKELQWLDKELQKIEREKQRLEREREKFLERDERLSKLRRSVNNGDQKKEVLVQTSTGFYRFQGISRKFTQRLYEWEKARGIRPEESTLMLLNPQYRSFVGYSPRMSISKETTNTDSSLPGIKLTRSKSVDSISNFTQHCELRASEMIHHPSSLSLNDVEELEKQCLLDSRPTSDPDRLNDPDDDDDDDDDMIQESYSDKEPEAMIVDVEDIVEETAAPLDTGANIRGVTHLPVYKVAQQDVDTLCETEQCISPKIKESKAIGTHSSYHIIEENIQLLKRLKDKEEICQHLETTICKLQDDIRAILRKKKQETVADGNSRTSTQSENKSNKTSKDLERKRQVLKTEGVTLQNSFREHSAQQLVLAKYLVGSMKKLQEANNAVATAATPKEDEDLTQVNDRFDGVIDLVQDLSSELLNMSEKLEVALSARDSEIRELLTKKFKAEQFLGQTSCDESSIDDLAYLQYSEELREIPTLLMNKILELKRELSYLCAASDMTAPRKERKILFEENQSSEKVNDSKEYRSTNAERKIEKSDSVPNVTITPKFLRKPKIITIDESLHEASKTKLPDSTDDEVFLEAKLSLKKPSVVNNDFTEANLTIKENPESARVKTYSNGVVKRKTKTRLKNNSKMDDDSCSDGENNLSKKTVKPRKNIKLKKNNDGKKSDSPELKDNTKTEKSIEKRDETKEEKPEPNIIVPACQRYVELSKSNIVPESPVEVFVKTTRKLFGPIGEEISPSPNKNTKEISVEKCVKENITMEEKQSVSNINILKQEKEMKSAEENTKNTNKDVMTKNIEVETCSNELNTQNQNNENEYRENILPTIIPSNLQSNKICNIQTTASLPPLPHSPTPMRRDRLSSKETAPSIRIMIARYNQRLTEQEGGKSPGGSSGSASPVAWRSPVAERRVRAQTEKYQEEVKRVLQQGSGSKYSPKWLGIQITKSASAGLIKVSDLKPDQLTTRRASVENEESKENKPIQQTNKLLKGILKSSSAGSLKSDRNKIIKEEQTDKQIEETKLTDLPSPTLPERIKVENIPPKIIRKYEGKPPSPKIPSSPDSLGSPLSHVRAQRIQRAKEEFLTRQISAPDDAIYCNIVSERKDKTSPVSIHHETNNGNFDRNRLSQISCGSDTSYDSNADCVLIKSASAGMINVDVDTYKKLSSSEQHTDGYVSLPRASKSQKDVPSNSKFGISSITSKFRKVKMRRSKERDSSKMNTVSLLCRQSLMVDINDSGIEHIQTDSISSNKSASNSPVLNRQESKDDNSQPGTSSTSTSWIKKSRLFKQK